MVRRGSYDEAIELLSRALVGLPGDPDVHYVLAIALLRGKRPKSLSLRDARAIGRHLAAAETVNSSAGHFFLLHGWLQWDFFAANGFASSRDALTLLEHATQVESTIAELDFLEETNPTIKGSPVGPVIEVLRESAGGM